MKTQRKVKADPDSYSIGTSTKARGSAPRISPKSNGNHPLGPYDHLRIGIVETSLNGKYMDVNEEFCRILGYTKKELLQLDLKDCTHEDDYALDIKLHEQLIAGKIPFYGLEKRYVRKDGQIIWAELTRSLVRNADGKPLGAVGVVVDISEYKSTERVLRESAENLRLATEAARMFKWELDLQKQLYTFADNFVQVLGFSAGLLPQNSVETVWKLSPAEDVQAISKAIAKAIKDHSDLHSLQYRLIDPESGRTVWLEVNAKVVYDERGNTQRMFGVAQNITERKQIVQDLARERELLERLFETMPVMVSMYDPETNTLRLNAEFERLIGWKTEETSALSLLESIYPDPDYRSQVIQRMAAAGRNDWVDVQLRTRAGRTLDSTWSNISILNGRQIGIGVDITERKRMENALRESEERFRALFNQATAGIAQSDMESRLIFVNPKLCEMLGYHESELIGKTLWELTDDRDAEENKRLFERMIAQGESYQFEKRFIRREGSTLWASVSVSAVHDQTGKPTGGVGVVVDITPRRQAEEALRAKESELQEIINRTPFMLTHCSRDLHYRFVSNAYARMIGRTPEQIAGKPILEIMGAEGLRAISPYIEKVLQGNQVEYETEVPFEGVGAPSLHVIYTPDRDEQGNVIGWFASITDVTARKRSERALAEFARQQEALYQLSDQLHHTNSLEDVYSAALDAILKGLQCERASILLFDDTDVMRFVAWRGLSNDYRKATEGHSPWEPGEKNPYPVCMGDARASDLSDSLKAAIQEEGICSLAFIPLISNGKLIGKFMVYFNESHDCSDVEIELSLMIARQLAFGIDRIKAENALRVSEAQLQVELADTKQLQMISGQLILEDNIDALYQQIIDAAIVLMRSDMASLQMFYPERNGLQLLAWKGFDPRAAAFWEWVNVNSNSSCAFAMHKGERVIVSDVETADFMTGSEDLEYYRLSNIKAMQSTPLVSRDGRLVGMISTHWRIPHQASEHELHLFDVLARQAADLIERKHSEEALRSSEERLQAMFAQAGVGVVLMESDCNMLQVNPKFCEIVGYEENELLGSSCLQMTHVDDREENIRVIEELLAGPGETTGLEKRYIRKDGSVVWVQLNIAKIRNTGGIMKQLVAVVEDITERKQSEEKLRASESLYRTIARSIPGGGVYVVDKNFRYLVAEGAVSEAFGFTREALEGQTVWEAFPGERGERMKDRLQRNFAGEIVDFETEHQGRVYWTRQAPLLDSIGQAIIVTLDITERKQVEAALRESEARFKAILTQATAGIVRKDAEGKLIFVNEAFCEMLGYTEADLLGKTVWEFMHQDDVAENKRSFDRLMIQGLPFKLERRFIRKDGSIIWVDASVSPLMGAEGRPQSAVAVEVDITGRKRAEEALQQLNLQLESRVQKRTTTIQAINQSLREEIAERKRIEEAARTSEEKLRTLFDLLPVGISFLDPQGQIIQMNSALPNIVRLSKEQLFNREYKSRKYIRADGTPMQPVEFAGMRALRENRTIYNVETGIVLEDGEAIWTSVSAAPVDVADVGVVVVTVDITENKRAEQALQESHGRLRILSQRLVEVQEEERRALARELHDRVGQTLAALNINLIIINSQLSTDISEEIVARLNDSMKLVGETIALVRDVMTDLRPAVLDDYGLEAALESHLSQYTSRYNNIKTAFEKPDRPIPRLGPSVEMTLLRIAQEALMNIAKHAHAKHVNLSLRQEEESVCLTIQDDGIGIESWQDANRPGSHGLTIMRERAEAFGGNLSVSSVPGQGTIVQAIIPFRNDHQAQTQEEQQL